MTIERIAEIQRYAVQGLSAAETAYLMNLTKNQVIGAAYRNGIIFQGGKMPKSRKTLCERLRTPCRNGHDRRDAFVHYRKRGRVWVVTCRTCHRISMQKVMRARRKGI